MPLQTPFKSFYYVRHGVTAANQSGLWCGGDWDIDLHPDGRIQAANLAPKIAALRGEVDQVFSSPMVRALQTTELVNAQAAHPVTVVDDLREWRIGQLERTPWSNALMSTSIDQWADPPGGETILQFKQRVQRGLVHCLEQAQSPLLVSHGAVGMIVSHILGIPETKFANCELYHITSRPQNGATVWALTAR